MSSKVRGKTILAILSARENIALIQLWSNQIDFSTLKTNIMLRYAIERAFMAIDAALRDIPTEFLEKYGIPINKINGFRNALAHTYDDILDERIVLTIKDDLPELDRRITAILDEHGSA